MVAPSFAASGAAFSGSDTSVAVGAPSGVVAGSVVLVAFFLNGTANQNVVAPLNWFAAENSPVQASNHWLYVFWHRAAGAEAGPYTFTWDNSIFREGQAHRYQDVVASGTPFDAGTSSAVSETNDTVTPSVSVTTLGVDRCVVHAATCWAGGTWTAPTGFTKRQQPAVGLSTLSDRTQAVAGSTGSVTATVTNADRRTAWLGALRSVDFVTVTGTGDAQLGATTGAGVGLVTVPGLGVASLGSLVANGVAGQLPSFRVEAAGREPPTRVAGREPGRQT